MDGGKSDDAVLRGEELLQPTRFVDKRGREFIGKSYSVAICIENKWNDHPAGGTSESVVEGQSEPGWALRGMELVRLDFLADCSPTRLGAQDDLYSLIGEKPLLPCYDEGCAVDQGNEADS